VYITEHIAGLLAGTRKSGQQEDLVLKAVDIRGNAGGEYCGGQEDGGCSGAGAQERVVGES
jgi:hypothetical protein